MEEETMKRLCESFGLTLGDHTPTGWDDFDLSAQVKLAKEGNVPSTYSTDYGFQRSYLSKIGFTNVYDLVKEQNAKKTKSTNFRSLQTTRPAIEHSSIPSLSSVKELQHTTIREIARKVNHIHYDRVLYVAVIHKPYRQVATNVLVQDEEGNCIMLSLYNFVAAHEDPEVVFPEGTRMALIAPYMKNSQDDRSKNLMLRCDNPQCVLIYDDYTKEDIWKSRFQEEMPMEILKEKGNEAFNSGNLTWARRLYSRVISSDMCDEHLKVACWSNRAEVALREHRWEDALDDAENVLSIESDHVKSKFRLAKAMIRLEMLPEALEKANELLRGGNAPNTNAVKKLVEEIKRLEQERNGHYDYDSMRKEEAAGAKKEPIFHANFASNKVDFGIVIKAPSGSSYRGCQANADFVEDELVSSSKAFAFTRIDPSTSMTIERNVYNRTLNKESDIALIGDVVRLLWKRPVVADQFYALSAGDEDKEGLADTEGMTINLPRIRRILNSNAFAQTDENEGTMYKWKRMQKSQQLGLTESELEEANGEFTNRGSGLWLRESLFNHSCTPNCAWVQLGDQIFIRTTRPVKKGEELCVSYTSLDKTFEEREKIFAGWIGPDMGFSCACDYCNLLRSNNELRSLTAEIDDAYTEAAKTVTLQELNMAQAAEVAMPSLRRNQIIQKFEHVPPKNKSCIAKLHVMNGTCIKSAGDDARALSEYTKALEIGYAVRGGTSIEHFTDLWRVVGASMACRNRDLAFSSLSKIWNSRDFQSISSPAEAKAAFKDLTLRYAIPWWKDEYDYSCALRMEGLVKDVCTYKSSGKNKKSAKRKAKRKARR